MYNMSALKGGKKMLIITFGTLTNYCTSKSCYKTEREREVKEKDGDKKREKMIWGRKVREKKKGIRKNKWTEVEERIHVGQVKTELWYDQSV